MDFYHGLSGHSGQCSGTLWKKSRESRGKVQEVQADRIMSMDKVQRHSEKHPESPGGLDNIQGQSPGSPWTKSNQWTVSMVSLDFVQGPL